MTSLSISNQLLKLADTVFNLVTGEINGFRAHGACPAAGRDIKADRFVFATGFNLNFFRFALAVDQQPVNTRTPLGIVGMKLLF